MEESAWSSRHEAVLKSWAERAAVNRLLHERAAVEYEKSEANYSIPIIIISALNSGVSFSSTYLPPTLKYYSPLVVGMASSLVGLIGTLKSFRRIDELLAGHRTAALSYAILSRQVVAQLAVARKDRRSTGIELVRHTAAELDRMLESSPTISQKLKMQYLKEAAKVAKQPDKADPTQQRWAMPENLYGDQSVKLTVDEEKAEREEQLQHALREVVIKSAERSAERAADEAARAAADAVTGTASVDSVRARLSELIAGLRTPDDEGGSEVEVELSEESSN